jgi:uncharacterized protein (TIGR04255 family)
MKKPISIDPCPIIDAVIEIRFTPNIDHNAVFGLLYNAIKNDFPGKVEPQTLTTIEHGKNEITTSQIFKLTNEKYVIQIGHNVLSISSYPRYTGWSDFYDETINYLQKIDEVGIISEINRLGMRYINFFENDIFTKIKINATLDNKEIDYKNTQIKTEISHDNFTSNLLIANNIEVQNKTGSIIDIDTYRMHSLEGFFKKKEQILKEIHDNEKELFFSLLKDEFVETLNPKYQK